VRLLLDTHAFLWFVVDDKRLSPDAKKLIGDADEVLLSWASIWEIIIKNSLGQLKLGVEGSVISLIQDEMRRNSFD